MGWWRTSNGDAVVGDGPVDTLMDAFQRLHLQAPPATLFDLVARAMASDAEDFGDASDFASARSTDAPEWSAEDLSVAKDALRSIAQEYEDSELERRPTPRELYETVDFAVDQLKRLS